MMQLLRTFIVLFVITFLFVLTVFSKKQDSIRLKHVEDTFDANGNLAKGE